MKLFDRAFVDSLTEGQLIARIAWAGDRWIVWPVDLDSPILVRELQVVSESGAVAWEYSQVLLDANEDDWVVLE